MAGPLIDTSVLEARLRDPALVIVDVRHDLARPDDWGEAEYRASHIPGAVFAHVDRDLSDERTGSNGRHPLPSREACEHRFARLGIGEDSFVVAYDQGSAMFASRLWWMLRWLGHDFVAVLDGGFDKWVREGRAVQAGPPPEARRASFHARDVGPLVTVEDLVADLVPRTLTLVDARAPERYRGEVEPLDPVAGHIPGARNRFYGTNLGPDGAFKPAQALRAEFAQLLGETPLDRIVHYCGSGVTACHNLLAMEVAGLPGTRLYPGSWSEWCSDSERPVAVGDETTDEQLQAPGARG